MPEPLKNLYNKNLIVSLSTEIMKVYGHFDAAHFKSDVLDDSWSGLELKARMHHTAQALRKYLPDEYPEAVDILMQVSPKFSGLEHMLFPAFVELYGLNDYDVSIVALACFTQHSSSEFAVRPFIEKYGDRMMAQMILWASSGNHHIRRLASEGCRPRLPWAGALPIFKKDPTAIIPILDKLRNDDSEYVRRSVANNLNDISKDNPAVVIELAKKWLGESSETDRLIKHGSRTLLKQADPEIMKLFGFVEPVHIDISAFQVQEQVGMGAELSFSFTLSSKKRRLGKLRLEYAIDFMKKNGKQARKIFKLSEAEYTDKEKSVKKMVSFRSISTRKYYVGSHGIAVIVNGHELARADFLLTEGRTPL